MSPTFNDLRFPSSSFNHDINPWAEKFLKSFKKQMLDIAVAQRRVIYDIARLHFSSSAF